MLVEDLHFLTMMMMAQVLELMLMTKIKMTKMKTKKKMSKMVARRTKMELITTIKTWMTWMNKKIWTILNSKLSTLLLRTVKLNNMLIMMQF